MDIKKEETFQLNLTKEEAVALTKALQIALNKLDPEQPEYWQLDNFEMDLQNVIKN